jgi:hypothetical protein
MDSLFYNRSIYSVIKQPVPACFLELERHLGPKVPANVFPLVAPGIGPTIALAENLCRRMGDVEFYAKSIADELATLNGTYTATTVSSLLVGHFGASKSVLDASAITLARLYGLGRKSKGRELTNKEMDFARQGKGHYWAVLQSEQGDVYRRYARFQGTVGEIVRWRDAAVHRVFPLVITSMARRPETNVHEIHHFNLALDPDPDFEKVWFQSQPTRWSDPLHFHRRWHPQLLALCEEVCRDITDRT